MSVPARGTRRACQGIGRFWTKNTVQGCRRCLARNHFLVPHYPSFLWECRRWPGGHANFAQERCQRMAKILAPDCACPSPGSAGRRLLLFDVRAPIFACATTSSHTRTYTLLLTRLLTLASQLESNISQCGAFAPYDQKRLLGDDPRIVPHFNLPRRALVSAGHRRELPSVPARRLWECGCARCRATRSSQAASLLPGL